MKESTIFKHMGKRCVVKNLTLQECPFFPAPAPFKIIGATDQRYLIEGPWTTHITFTVNRSSVTIIDNEKDSLGETPFA